MIAQPPEPKKKPSKWAWAAIIVAVLFVIGAVMSVDDEPETTAVGDAAEETGQITDATDEAAPVDAPAEPAFLDAEQHSGTGDDVITTEWPGQLGVVTFECPQCSGNTVLQSDGGESLLVNTIGSYQGTRWINVRDGSRTTTFTIKATGAWTLTVADLDAVKRATASATGSGDDVVLLDVESTKATISNQGQGNFAVHAISDTRIDLAVNEIGSYQGTVPLRGPALVQVTSEGDWSIEPS